MMLQSLSAAKPSHPSKATEPLIFPNTIRLGMRFRDREHVKLFIQGEVDVRRLHFGYNLYFNRASKHYIFHLVCKLCQARISFQADGDLYDVVRADTTHTHGLQETNEWAEQQLHNSYIKQPSKPKAKQRKSSRKSEPEEPAGPIFEVRSMMERSFLNDQEQEGESAASAVHERSEYSVQPQVEANFNFRELPKTLHEVYSSLTVNESSDDGLPCCLTTTSMRSNYSRYGDILYFSVYRNLLEEASHRIEVAVFYVCDSNVRVLLAGVAFFCPDYPQASEKLFQQFFKVQKCEPLSIVTSYEPAVGRAISRMKDLGIFHGSHLLNPWDVLETISSKLEGSTFENMKTMSSLMRCMLTRNQKEYKREIAHLSEQPSCKNTIPEVLKTYDSSFYCLIGDAFVGLRKNVSKTMNSIMKAQFPINLSIPQFLKCVVELDSSLVEQSRNSFEPYQSDLGFYLQDDRLVEVMKCFEKQVSERFLENYMQGLRECKTIKQVNGQGTKFEVTINESESYSITDWKCECKEQEKTGVACAHLISVAMGSKHVSYMELVNWKWRKSRPTKN